MMKDSSRILCLVLLLPLASAQNISASASPTLFQFFANTVNGSFETGHCSNVVNNICRDPTSSVLFDGIIPTLTGLDGNMWASQLLTTRSNFEIVFSFSGTPGFVGVRRVEIVLFNCPDWGISVQSITLRTSASVSGTINLNVTSCDSLVRVCIGNFNTNPTQTDLTLWFTPINSNYWVHIAEVTFYGAGSECQNDIVLTTPIPPLDTTSIPPPDTTITTPIPPQDTTITPSIKTSLSSATQAELTTHPETVCNTLCPTSTSTSSTILTSVLTAISTALLATVIFVLVQIALCKCRPKATPGGAESAPSAGGEGLAEYEQVDIGGAAGSDPTYMEVGAGGKSNTMELKENAAYGAF